MISGISWTKLCVVLLVLTNGISGFGRGQSSEPFYDCLNTGDYMPNSTYSANLHTAISALYSNISEYGFSNASIGHGTDTANAVALCRADVNVDRCHRCVEAAATRLVQLCPNKMQAICWYDYCTLHYSNMPMDGDQENILNELRSAHEATNPEKFRNDRTVLVDRLRAKAASGNSFIKVGAGSRNTSDSETIYALLQCIPTLSRGGCNNCLILASRGLPMADNGGSKLMSRCSLRYDVDLFYDEDRLRELDVLVAQAPDSPSPPGASNESKNSANTVIIVAVSIAAFVIILVACVVIYLRKRAKKTARENREAEEETSTVESFQYDFRRISAATNGFADANKLGQGGFGTVYRGKLSNGQEIAVKRLSRNSMQGGKEFKNEVLLVAKLQHRNLVRLLGFSMERTERLLIYEFVPNASLDQFIFDPAKRSQLDWQRRYNIIGGIARGLLYLHEDSRLRIIHRDLKPSNILLDGQMNPKIADFGMARLLAQDEPQRSTSRIVGTYGYMPPEYAIYGRFSVKSDVFSFGVLVLEIISGTKNIASNEKSSETLLTSAWKNWQEGTAENVIDPMLRATRYSFRDVLRCIHIGLLCVQENAANRPTMNSVMLMLSSSTITLPVTSRPAFVMSGGINSKTDTTETSSQNEISATEVEPR